MKKLIKNYGRNEKVVTFIIIWVIYSLTVTNWGNVDWWAEEMSDGWYQMIEECETDDYGNKCWPVILDGPFTKAEIDNMYLKDERDANEFMKKYGTIYNLRLKENNVLFGVINIILWYCIFFGVPYLIYHTFYEKSAK